jgi:PAS domain S-box-containing protein
MSVNDPGTEKPTPVPTRFATGERAQEGGTFRWQALFQRAGDPVFVLDHRRRILFVNRAWEELTGISGSEACGLSCVRRAPLPQDPRDMVVRSLCCPSPEVLRGTPARTHRFFPASAGNSGWWSIDFLPIGGQEKVLFVVGRIALVSRLSESQSAPLPEKLAALRQKLRLRHHVDSLVSSVPAFRRIVDQVRLAGRTRVPVLLVGEAGTGKTWIARTIHCLRCSMEEAFAIIDCNRLPPAFAADFLFADVAPGSPLPARCIYLRNPVSLPRDTQAQLAQWLDARAEEGPHIVVGCEVDPEVDARAGRLLEELLVTISVLRINLLPLRDRLADLPMLADGMLRRINNSRAQPVAGLTSEAWDYLRAYSWPGNLTELYAVLKSSSGRTQTDQIDAAHLPASVRLAVRMQDQALVPAEKKMALDKILQEAERRLILAALRKAGGNRTKAADLLSIWRPRLLRRMEALGIAQG